MVLWERVSMSVLAFILSHDQTLFRLGNIKVTRRSMESWWIMPQMLVVVIKSGEWGEGTPSKALEVGDESAIFGVLLYLWLPGSCRYNV